MAEFLSLVRLLCRLSHPGLLAYRAAGQDEELGCFYLATELGEQSLRPLMTGLREQDLVGVGLDLARALEYLHARGHAHGALRPENVFRADGVWKLAEPAGSSCAPGVSPAGDVFCLGRLLLEGLRGPGASLATLPAAWQSLLGGCLEGAEASRPTAARVAEALGRMRLASPPPGPPRGGGSLPLLTAREVGRLEGHSAPVRSMALVPGENLVLSASDDGALGLWEAGSRTLLRWLPVRHGEALVACSPVGGLAASATRDRCVCLWRLPSGRAAGRLQGFSGWVRALAFSPDGLFLAVGCSDGSLQLWDVTRGRRAALFASHAREVAACAFSPDGRLLASVSGDGTWRLDEVATGAEILRRVGVFAMTSVAFSADGRLVATGTQQGTLSLWEAESGRQIRELEPHVGAVRSLAFCSGQNLLASASEDRTVRLWALPSGTVVQRLLGHAGPVRAVAFFPEERSAVTAGDDAVLRLWELGSPWGRP